MLEISDVFGATSVIVEMSNNPSLLKFSTQGPLGKCEITIPRYYIYFLLVPINSCVHLSSDSDSIVSFTCENNTIWTYPSSSFQLGMKALIVSKETFLRINSRGIMCIQHLVESDKGETYIDFLMASEESIDSVDDLSNFDYGVSKSSISSINKKTLINASFDEVEDDFNLYSNFKRKR